MTNNYSKEFAYHIHGSGEVFISHRGRLTRRLRGSAATDFLVAADAGDPQHVMAEAVSGRMPDTERPARRRAFSRAR